MDLCVSQGICDGQRFWGVVGLVVFVGWGVIYSAWAYWSGLRRKSLSWREEYRGQRRVLQLQQSPRPRRSMAYRASIIQRIKDWLEKRAQDILTGGSIEVT